MKADSAIVRSLALPFAIVAFCTQISNSQASETHTMVRIVGSTTVEKALLEPNQDRIRAATGIELDLKCRGTGDGLLNIVKGRAELAGTSEPLADAIKGANERAKETHDTTVIPNNLIYTELGHDRIVVIVNAKNKAIKKLNKKQLADIFTQKIINWKELGGNDEPILVYLSPTGSATRSLFQKTILDGAEFSIRKDVGGGYIAPVYSTVTELDDVAKTANSIAVVAESTVHGTDVKIIESPVIDRPLGVITVGKPSAEVQKLIDYLKSLQGLK